MLSVISEIDVMMQERIEAAVLDLRFMAVIRRGHFTSSRAVAHTR